MSNGHLKQNGFHHKDPQETVISVEPLNSVPYEGSSLVPDNSPAVLFMPEAPDEDEEKHILSASKGGVILTGVAALGKIGPLIGSLDMAETMDGYLFTVSLPGVSTDRDKFSCEIEATGKVVIKGVTTTGERIVRKLSQVFVMETQNLPPSGEFTVTFTLPGPVDNKTFNGSFFSDGILVGKIKKQQQGEAL